MKHVILSALVLVSCGSVTTDSTIPLTRETCSSKVMRASNDATEYMLERDMYKAQLLETQELLSVCNTLTDNQQEKIYSCNALVNTYESDLVNSGCATAGIADEKAHQEKQ